MRALVVACGLVFASGAFAAAPKFPALTAHVVDQAQVLSAETEARLEQQLMAHERARGEQIVVATIASLQGRDADQYAVDLFRHWRLGDRKQNNGVLLMVAPKEREGERAARIEVGYGVEGVLTDALTSVIIRDTLIPAFKSGEFDRGITTAVAQIIGILSGDAGVVSAPATAPGRDEPADIWPLLLLFAVVWVLLGGRSRRHHSIWGGPFGGGGWGGGGFGGGGFGGGGWGGGGGGSSGGGGASGRW